MLWNADWTYECVFSPSFGLSPVTNSRGSMRLCCCVEGVDASVLEYLCYHVLFIQRFPEAKCFAWQAVNFWGYRLRCIARSEDKGGPILNVWLEIVASFVVDAGICIVCDSVKHLKNAWYVQCRQRGPPMQSQFSFSCYLPWPWNKARNLAFVDYKIAWLTVLIWLHDCGHLIIAVWCRSRWHRTTAGLFFTSRILILTALYIYKFPTKPLMVATSCLACVCVCVYVRFVVLLWCCILFKSDNHPLCETYWDWKSYGLTLDAHVQQILCCCEVQLLQVMFHIVHMHWRVQNMCCRAYGVWIMRVILGNHGISNAFFSDPETGIFFQNGQKHNGTHFCVPKGASGNWFKYIVIYFLYLNIYIY